MTAKTRRRVFLSVLMLALTLPAEAILLKALQQSDDQAAVQQWASSLDAAELAAAADSIQSYPFAYRQQIMRNLSPDRRAEVWQSHIEQYIRRHQELDGGTVIALRAAQSALTPGALSDPTAEDRKSMRSAAEQVQTLLGRDDAWYLLHDLGPRDGTSASAEPLSMKLASMVRHQFVLLARNGDCECSMGSGCSGYFDICSSQEYCQWDVQWPMCGWGWMDICDGMCVSW